MNGFAISPIGVVQSPIRDFRDPEAFRDIESRIEIYQDFVDALDGIEEEPAVVVLFRFHKIDAVRLRAHPRGDFSRPEKGVFSLCAPMRPSRIGVTCCPLLGRKGRFLHVKHLDALDGSPVLDIRKYSAFYLVPQN